MGKYFEIGGIEPEITMKRTEHGVRLYATYTQDMLAEYARKITKQVDETVFAMLADMRGYVKPVRCRDCEYADPEPPSDKRSRKDYQGGYWCEYWSEGIGAWCPADGFCHAGKPREKACRNADENAAAFADAPTQETAREPMQPPTFELGA